MAEEGGAQVSTVLESARRVAPLAAETARSNERERALGVELVNELRDGGLLHMCLPGSLGGGEVEPRELILALEELARGDGAAGWCAMVASTSCLLGAYLPTARAEEVYAGGRNVLAGVFAPRGRALRRERDFLVGGRWPFVSGVGHCDWLMAGCLVFGESGDAPEALASGAPDVRLMLMPRERVQVLDTWSVAGLCGTGSHDIAADRVEVPHELGVSLFTQRPLHDGALYAFPLFGLLALGICAVGLGIARGALDELSALARGKRPAPGARALAERSTIQAEVARAEGGLRSARAFVLEQVDEAWRAAQDGGTLSEAHRLGLRLAATHGTWAAAEAVTAAYHAAGGVAIYLDSPLQRRLRDIHVATQHIMVAPATWELTGRLLLGLPTDITQL
ncbi:MAG TPA: acyl-CoA dehydrogenase family protein [Solirubrobacteraceae bacterium]